MISTVLHVHEADMLGLKTPNTIQMSNGYTAFQILIMVSMKSSGMKLVQPTNTTWHHIMVMEQDSHWHFNPFSN
jgi:hypothetical protein